MISQISFTINYPFWKKKINFPRFFLPLLFFFLSAVSIYWYIYFYQNGLGLAYNDARSHLDIGRRVVEGLKPGLAQLGSVWLPLPHLLMVPTVWNDFMWHSGLSGSLISMISFVAVNLIIYQFLKKIGVSLFGRLVGVFIFTANLNILYMQYIAMTELLLLALMTAGVYYLVIWYQTNKLLDFLKTAFFVMLSTLVRYDGWFLLFFCSILIFVNTIRKKGYKETEGLIILFCTLAGFGIFLWLLWNQLIFKDALYFAFGPFSARAQQLQMEKAGVLPTKGNLPLSIQIYLYALIYNSGAFTALLGFFGGLLFWLDKKLSSSLRLAALSLLAPFLFNILALYLGHSVLYVQGLSGNTWFNVRYGIMMLPSIAIFIGFLVHKLPGLRWMILGLIFFVTFFQFTSRDAVTIDDARVGSSQKNVAEISSYLKKYAKNEKGFILISAASHDAIIFSSGLPMSRFIHEGTGSYWESATTSPDRWARWIIMRTYDNQDLTWKAVSKTSAFKLYALVAKYPFADVYELKPEYRYNLHLTPVNEKDKTKFILK